MPSHSTSLADEGIVFVRHLLTEAGLLCDLSCVLAPSRDPQTVTADLLAQLAANHHAAKALQRLGPPDTLLQWMRHLQDLSAEASARVIEALNAGQAEDDLDGMPISLHLEPSGSTLKVSLVAPPSPHGGNLNTPKSVVRAAVLYALRVLAGADLPLNEGALRHVHIHPTAGSVFAPPNGVAVAGGNVETSQRIVDLFLTAAGHMAFSCGTMSNLTLGGPDWAYYETIGGGQGASVRGDGASARQCHMTNTSATDAEVLERRLPLRVHHMGIRRLSGGDGLFKGGQGIHRELEVLQPATASLLVAWRKDGSSGEHGGMAGAAGAAFVIRNGDPSPWSGEPIALRPGDRIRILTPGGGGWGEKKRLSS